LFNKTVSKDSNPQNSFNSIVKISDQKNKNFLNNTTKKTLLKEQRKEELNKHSNLNDVKENKESVNPKNSKLSLCNLKKDQINLKNKQNSRNIYITQNHKKTNEPKFKKISKKISENNQKTNTH
jgi:hypothetical protein